MKAIVEEGRERTLQVDSLDITDEDIGETYMAGEAAPFWESISLEDIAERQGVVAVGDLDEVSAGEWSEGEARRLGTCACIMDASLPPCLSSIARSA